MLYRRGIARDPPETTHSGDDPVLGGLGSMGRSPGPIPRCFGELDVALGYEDHRSRGRAPHRDVGPGCRPPRRRCEPWPRRSSRRPRPPWHGNPVRIRSPPGRPALRGHPASLSPARGSAGPSPLAPVPDERDPKIPGSPREPLRELTLGRTVAPPPPHPGGGNGREESDEDELERHRAAMPGEIRGRPLASGMPSAALGGGRVPGRGRPGGCGAVRLVQRPGRLLLLARRGRLAVVDLSLLDDVAGCFEAVAEALPLVSRAGGRRGALERALPLLAEAQSMLRRALQRLRAPNDPDQMAVYQMVRDAAARHRIFVKRFLRADDPADPAGWPGLLSRIESAAASGQQSRQQKERIDRMREPLEAIRRGAATDRDWEGRRRARGRGGRRRGPAQQPGDPGAAPARDRRPPGSRGSAAGLPAGPPRDRPLPGDPARPPRRRRRATCRPPR